MPDQRLRDGEQILRDHGCSDKVIRHCRAVAECAREYAEGDPEADKDLLFFGAMLHDIGRSVTHSIHHAQEGADLLRKEGFSENLARIVECHTGAGLTADECTMLGLSPRECIPSTTEEKIVTHADNLIAGHQRVSIEESLGSAIHLPRKVRRRMYHLSLEVELLCHR